MRKHTAYDLKQMQMLPLEVKVEMTKQRIEDWYNYWDGQVYVSFSGGKDSTVLKHVVDSMFDDVPAVYIDTGLEYPEIRQFVKSIKNGQHSCFNSDVEILRPEKRFDEVIVERGYPVISKEVSNNVDGARKYLQYLTDRQTDSVFRKLQKTGWNWRILSGSTGETLLEARIV